MDCFMIDVSYHNGVINWDEIKANGKVQAVMIRAGYGAGNIDTRFVENIKACNRLGIPCGVYWFSYAYTVDMAEREAQYCLNAIKPYKVSLPVAFDWEYDSKARAKAHGVNATRELTCAMATRFCRIVEDAGYTPILYTNPDYINQHFPSTLMPTVDRWIARYGDKKPDNCTMWQYGEGTVSGAAGKIDLNRLYKDYTIPKVTTGQDVLTDGRYRLLRDLPAWATDTIRALVEEGSLHGETGTDSIDDTVIDLSKDMLRVLKIVCDHVEKKVNG